MLGLRAQLEHEREGGLSGSHKHSAAPRGADVNKQTTTNDNMPLSLACAHLNVVEVFLQQGADPYHKLKDNSTMPDPASRAWAPGGHGG